MFLVERRESLVWQTSGRNSHIIRIMAEVMVFFSLGHSALGFETVKGTEWR